MYNRLSTMDLKYCLVWILTAQCINTSSGSKLFLMLIDGFRWDYFNLEGLELTGFPRLFREGVKAEYMVPSFPTNSYPNYYTLMTGLYVEDHGVVGNYMWDEKTGETFELGANPDSLNSHWWEHAEPLWVTAAKQGKRSFMYHWRECNVSIHDVRPTFCLPYSGMPRRDEIHTAMKTGVKKLKEGADAIYLYHQDVDHYGHIYGPYSKQVKESVQELDADINMLLNEIDDHGLDEEVNVLVFSDHGMTDIHAQQIINISKALNMSDINVISESLSQVYIWPHEGLEEKVYKDLKSLSHEHLKVYYTGDLKDRWFFKKHRRIPPIYLTTEPGWYIVHPRSSDIYAEGYDTVWLGNHGFDNAEADMRSIFVAKGPSFKRNYVAPGFPNVDMYQIMCKILNLAPQPHNGTWNSVRDMFPDTVAHLEL